MITVVLIYKLPAGMDRKSTMLFGQPDPTA